MGAKKLTIISLVAGILVSAGTLVVWATDLTGTVSEHFQLTSSNANYIALIEYDKLNAILKQRRLTHAEWVRFCQYGRRIGVYTKSFPCPPR